MTKAVRNPDGTLLVIIKTQIIIKGNKITLSGAIKRPNGEEDDVVPVVEVNVLTMSAWKNRRVNFLLKISSTVD